MTTPTFMVEPAGVALRIRWRLRGMHEPGAFLYWGQALGARYKLQPGFRRGELVLVPLQGTLGEVASGLIFTWKTGELHRDLGCTRDLVRYGLDGYPVQAFHALDLAAPLFAVEPAGSEPFMLTLFDWRAYHDTGRSAHDLADLRPERGAAENACPVALPAGLPAARELEIA